MKHAGATRVPVAPFEAGRSVSASREGVVRMANAGTRKAVVVVRVEW